MGIQEHKAQTKSDRLIQAMDRLSSNIERLIALQYAQTGEVVRPAVPNTCVDHKEATAPYTGPLMFGGFGWM